MMDIGTSHGEFVCCWNGKTGLVACIQKIPLCRILFSFHSLRVYLQAAVRHSSYASCSIDISSLHEPFPCLLRTCRRLAVGVRPSFPRLVHDTRETNHFSPYFGQSAVSGSTKQWGLGYLVLFFSSSSSSSSSFFSLFPWVIFPRRPLGVRPPLFLSSSSSASYAKAWWLGDHFLRIWFV